MAIAIVGEEQQALEAEHIAYVQAWSGCIADWTIRSAAMRKEREQLEKALTEKSGRMVMKLIRLGYTLPEAEMRIEQLLERAFTPGAE